MLTQLQTKLKVLESMAVGHRSGVADSVRSSLELNRLRRDHPIAAPPPAQVAATALHADGYLRHDPGYDAQLLQSLQDGLRYAERPGTSVAMGGRIPESVRYIVDPLRHVPQLRELLTDELCDILRAWYGTQFRVTTVRMWRIAHIPTAEANAHHFGNLWHVDGHRLDTLKLFVQITPDVSIDGAAFRLLSRPDTRRAFRRGFRGQDVLPQTLATFIDEHTQVFDDAPGQAMLVDTDLCLHRAGNPLAGTTRGMVQLMFAPDPTGAPRSRHDYLADVPLDDNVYEGAIA